MAEFDLDDWISQSSSLPEKKPVKQINLSEEQLFQEREEQIMLIRAYPRIFYRLIQFLKSDAKWMRFRGSAWERHVIHSLCGYLALDHDSRRVVGEKEFCAEVSKPQEYRVPEDLDFQILPEVMWETQVLEFTGEFLSFEESVVKHSGIYFASAKFASETGNDSEIVFSAGLSKEEQNAAFTISKEFGLNSNLIKHGDFEFVRVWKSGESSSSAKVDQLIAFSITKREEYEYDRTLEISLNPILENIYDSGLVYDSTENAVRCIAGVTGRTGRYLQWLTQAHKFQKTLEIGLAYGISTLHICSAHMKNEVEGFHTSIDPFQTKDWKSIGLLNLERSGFKNFRFFEEPSEYVLPRLCSSGEISSHDLILIDGNHLYDYALLDLFYASRLVKVGGFIVLDDTDTASIIEVLKYALKNWHFLIPYKPGCFGRVFTFQKRFEKDPRPWFFSLN